MVAPILNRRDLEFLIYEFFNAEELCQRQRYSDHNRETFDAAINTAQAIAEKYLAPFRSKIDTHQPSFDGSSVYTIPEIKRALDAIIDAGLVSPGADYDAGGMQLPGIVTAAAMGYLTAAGSTTVGYISLTNANANLIDAYGSEAQKRLWVEPQRSGRFAGTMAMSEPHAGSALADLTTSAEKTAQGHYLIRGSKIWISGGDHDLSENIVHLVLARVKGAPVGVKGISLFIVPKFLLNDDGSIGKRNDVALSGLFHKMGGRGQTSTALAFGEQAGAIGYLVGEENRGLRYMFHMMNEARVMVGSMAAMLALTGYQYSLDYAKQRPQGRLPSCKDPATPAVNIIEHADVKRMLLAQKAYAEGAAALCFYGAQLADDTKTAASDEERHYAQLLLDFLTPIIKTWPSEYGPRANSLAIQVLGGSGYVNEHPVEMFYRDNRLNPIHEGTTGIQSLDLLARKVPMNNLAGYQAVLAEFEQSIHTAAEIESLNEFSARLANAILILQTTTESLLGAMAKPDIDLALANSVKYLELFGHVVLAWMWLRMGIVAANALQGNLHESDRNFYQGKLQAMQYFFRYELIEIKPWSELLCTIDSTTVDMHIDWF